MLFFNYEEYKGIVYALSGMVFLLYLFLYRRKALWLKAFGQKAFINRFSKIPTLYRNLLKGMSVSAACCALGLVILHPMWQTTHDHYEKEGLEIVFVLDVSVSMLAEDVNPIGWNAQRWKYQSRAGAGRRPRGSRRICRPGVLTPAVSHKRLRNRLPAYTEHDQRTLRALCAVRHKHRKRLYPGDGLVQQREGKRR